MPDDENERLRELQHYAVLNTPAEARFDRITALAARLFHVPVALISLVDEHRQWFKSRYGTQLAETPRDISFCTHAILSDEVMVVPDATRDPRFASNPLVTGPPYLRFYAGAPLLTAGGFRIGTLCLNDTVAREGLSPEQKATLTGLAGMVVDELEFRLAERDRREAERLFTSVFETAPVAMSVTNDEGRLMYINPVYCRLFDYSPAELMGRFFWELIAEDAGAVERAHAAFIAGTGEMPAAWRVRAKDGRALDLYGNFSRLVTEDGRKLCVTALTDVTGIRRAEAALRESNQRLAQAAALIESSDEAIIGATRDGAITSWNAGAERLYGYSAGEIAGSRLDELAPAELRDEQRSLRQKVERGEHIVSCETVHARKDGTRIQVSLTLSPVMDAHGNMVAVSAIARDMTGRELLEEQLLHSQKMEAVALLAGGVAHDFNNLLTIIIGYGRILLTEAGAGPLREYVQEILYSAERASALTSQLLAFSRKQVTKPRVLDLNEVVESMQRLLGRIVGEHISLRTLSGAGLGRVKADPGQIEQIIANMAVNARDAMPRGGTLTIETANVELDQEYLRKHPESRPGPYVMLAVSDTGTGMAPELLQRIFEPFFTTKEKGKGTGLGLSIIHGIVKQSGGEIWVESEPGKGTTFKIYLPQVFETADSWRPSHAGSIMPRGAETLLLVEDEQGVQKMVEAILSRLGYAILAAHDGPQALELCASHPDPIHLMLTDVVMPGMAGPDLARAVRILRPETKIMFMSGYTDSSVFHQELIDAGSDFLQKPFTPEELAQRIREALDRRE